jgi:cysteinyl-tRNA synthetase
LDNNNGHAGGNSQYVRILQKEEMALTLYNYLTRKKELFKPIKSGSVGLYTCGPTVYDRVHIGNLRTYIFEDILKKTLEYNGYKIKHVMNITDVEDKIIKKMREENKTLKQVTVPYLNLFFEDVKKLGIKKADYFPKATEHIKEMMGLIEILLKKQFAYKAEDGSVYFDISKYKKYGSFSRLQKKELKHGARIKNDEYNKKNAGDFVLWKSAKPEEISWPAPFGTGRPGWHLECSVMSMKYLGKTFDIHAGAVDLIFPHHENEIAQSECATGKKFVNYWTEGEHLLVNNRKMSKSLRNFYTLEDIGKRKFEPLTFRYLVLNTHYRSKLNFTWPALKSAEESLNNLRQLLSKQYLKKQSRNINKEKEYREKFKKTLNNDLNMPKALSIVWELARDAKISQASKHKLIEEFDKILGLDLKILYKIPVTIKELTEQREQFRQEKNWQKADELRKKAKSLGWLIEDTQLGPALTKI